MNFKIDNVGIVKDSSFIVDGLTIITGDNNSGKSTVGKSLYSIINSVSNLNTKALNDRKKYCFMNVIKAVDLLNLDLFLRNKKLRDAFAQKFPLVFQIMIYNINEISKINSINEIKEYINVLIQQIDAINYAELIDELQVKTKQFGSEKFNQNKTKCIERLKEIIDTIFQDSNLSKYTGKKILDGLNNVFNEQTAPVKNPNNEVKIVLSDLDEKKFNIKISNGKINDNCYNGASTLHSFLINDVNILDKIGYPRNLGRIRNNFFNINDNDFYDVVTPDNLDDVLLDALTSKITAFESQTFSQTYESLLSTINDVFSDEIVVVDGKYQCKDTKLDVRNLATGSKLFVILKTLIEHGKIDDQTVIVLDEPENHLHPKWQLILAELIVQIVRQLDCKFIITTHSPSFLLAINTKEKQLHAEKITNYYYATKQKDEYFTVFECVNDKIDEMHYALNKPFIDISNLFDDLSDESENNDLSEKTEN